MRDIEWKYFEKDMLKRNCNTKDKNKDLQMSYCANP